MPTANLFLVRDMHDFTTACLLVAVGRVRPATNAVLRSAAVGSVFSSVSLWTAGRGQNPAFGMGTRVLPGIRRDAGARSVGEGGSRRLPPRAPPRFALVGAGDVETGLARISHTPSGAICCGSPSLRSGPDFPWTVGSHTARREIRTSPRGDASSRRLATKGYEKCGIAPVQRLPPHPFPPSVCLSGYRSRERLRSHHGTGCRGRSGLSPTTSVRRLGRKRRLGGAETKKKPK